MSIAAATAGATTSIGAMTGTTPGEFLRVILSLVAVVALVLVIGWFARRAQVKVRHGGRRLRCLETLPVGGKERVLLLEVGAKQVLVGASPSGVRLLAVLDEPIPEPTEPASATGRLNLTDSFRTVLAQWGRSR